MAEEHKTVLAIDLGAATLRMRLSRFAPGYPLHKLGEVFLPLDGLPVSASNIAPEEVLAGPKRLLEASQSPVDATLDAAPVFCPNPACSLARREWPAIATICALCGTRLVPRAAIVAEELIGQAMTRAAFDLERSIGKPVKPDIALASAPVDWTADIRYRYLDFLKISFPGAEVRLVDDTVAIARDALESPDTWRLPGIYPNERILVIDSGARRTQFFTAVSSPMIGFFDPAYAVETWGGIDCDHLIAGLVAERMNVEFTTEVEAAWSRAVRRWKEGLSASTADPAAVAQSLHLPIGGSGETLEAGPVAKDVGAILRAIEQRIVEVVDGGLSSLALAAKVDVVLLAGGNARWPYFETVLRSRFPETKIGHAPAGYPAAVSGLPWVLLADTMAWRLAPGQIEDDVDEEEVEVKHVPSITELFAAPPSSEPELPAAGS